MEYAAKSDEEREETMLCVWKNIEGFDFDAVSEWGTLDGCTFSSELEVSASSCDVSQQQRSNEFEDGFMSANSENSVPSWEQSVPSWEQSAESRSAIPSTANSRLLSNDGNAMEQKRPRLSEHQLYIANKFFPKF